MIAGCDDTTSLPNPAWYSSAFRALAGPRRPFLAVLGCRGPDRQYPGRQDRIRGGTIDDIRVLADVVVQVLAPWRDRPIALFGHSMASVVAAEVALRLRQQEEAIGLLGFRQGRPVHPNRTTTDTSVTTTASSPK
ncbi:thioesterase II family protein [Amycolatopsis sp. cmx-4-68]|uniref:thioesterase II family protein n=1 Tax=Amycolatopsis sp. cmx-4-68 TaxID=2790938 RepID=UPI003978A550